jgi:hypothetical protein
MKNLAALLVMGLAGFAMTAKAETLDLTKLPPPVSQKGVLYAKDIRPLFETACFRCHGESRPRGEVRLDTLELALKSGRDGKIILPGNSKESRLVIAVAQLDKKTAMPQMAKPLTAEQVGLIRAWIDQGAK